jgi:hypothetical protein
MTNEAFRGGSRQDGNPGPDPAVAFEGCGLADPRPELRARLRLLRDSDPAAFERAKSHHDNVLAACAGAEQVVRWIEYGGQLGDLTSPGQLLQIDETGRAAPWTGTVGPDVMVLHLPDDGTAGALAPALPLRPSPAQRAAHQLLVGRKLSL